MTCKTVRSCCEKRIEHAHLRPLSLPPLTGGHVLQIGFVSNLCSPIRQQRARQPRFWDPLSASGKYGYYYGYFLEVERGPWKRGCPRKFCVVIELWKHDF